MSSWPETASFHELLPTTIKFCRICQRDTPHQVRGGRGVIAVICIPCLGRALRGEIELKELMANSELLSRSQLLLQYLFAVDMMIDNNEALEPSPDISEVRDTAGDPECLD